MKTKHTPGPWKTNVIGTGNRHGVEVQIRYSKEHGDGILGSLGGYGTTPEDNINNAALIAAAPELLQALKNIVASAPLKGLPLALEIDIQSACAVIAKADGWE